MNVERFAVDLARPLSTAAGGIERREGFLVRLAVDGTAGVGEATPLPPWTESVEACREALDAVADESPADARTALDPVETPAAAHGVELAALDATARAAGVPLAGLLAGDDPTAANVPVNATLGDGDAGATADAARDAIAGGFETLKVKVGTRSPGEAAERLRAVREAVGPDVELRADANGAWASVDAAREALERVAPLGVSYVEQPLPAENLEGHAALRGGPVGVALDESLARHGPAAVLDAAAADVLILKPMALGGPAAAAAVAARAREAGVVPVVTTTIDAVYARTAAVHVAATLPDPPACGLATADMLAEDLAHDPAPVADGSVAVPDGPGNLGGDSP